MNAKRKGSLFERKTKARYEQEGWHVTKAGGSLGVADLVCLKAGHRPRLVQVKAGQGGPFAHFGPAARAELLEVAKHAGAVAELVHWPPRARGPRILDEAEWP